MQQTFVKRIQGHHLEFNQLLHEAGYTVSINDIIDNQVILTMKKDSRGHWFITKSENLPVWINEITTDIHNAIVEFESRATNNVTFTTTTNTNYRAHIQAFVYKIGGLY